MEEQFEQLITAINAANVPTFLDWAPIILSVISVFAAIYIPWRIAQKQNRISIFDKLYAAYSELLLVKSFAIAISEYKFDIEMEDALRNRELFLVHFETAFGYHPDVSDIIACKEGVGSATAALRKNEMRSYMIPMLISKSNKEKDECAKALGAIYEPLFCLLTEMIMLDLNDAAKMDSYLREFVKAVTEFFKKYAEVIEEQLLCKK